MTVITLSRQFGSGAEEVIAQICQATGFTMFDKHILAKAALEVGLPDQEIIDFSEEHYKVNNLLDRIFNRSRPVALLRTWKEDEKGIRQVEEFWLSEQHALSLVGKAVETAHKMGNVIVVGRGGQVLLKNEPDVLHVRLVADLEDRILRVRKDPAMANHLFTDSVEARRAAQALIEKNDTASSEYLRRFFGVDWANPLLYHMIINTSKMSTEQAASIIVEAVQHQPVMALA